MKAFYAAMLIVLSLFVALGAGVFIKGAQEHRNRPLVSLDDSGVQARLNDTSAVASAFIRVDGDAIHALC